MGLGLKIETKQGVEITLTKNDKEIVISDYDKTETIILEVNKSIFASLDEKELLILYDAIKIFCFGNIGLGNKCIIYLISRGIVLSNFNEIFSGLYKILEMESKYHDNCLRGFHKNIDELMIMVSHDCAHTRIYKNLFVNDNTEIAITTFEEKKRKLETNDSICPVYEYKYK